MSSCLDGYPNVSVFVVLNENEENYPGMPLPCGERAAYIGISTCDTPPLSAAYRLPDRCSWQVPSNFIPTIDELITFEQPPEAVPGESAVVRLESMTREGGMARHESLQLLVSVDAVEVLRRVEGDPFVYPPR